MQTLTAQRGDPLVEFGSRGAAQMLRSDLADPAIYGIAHDRKAIARVCDRVVVLRDGKAVEIEAIMDKAATIQKVQ